MLTTTQYRDRIWWALRRPSDLDEQLKVIAAAWQEGTRARGEIDSLYFDAMVFEGFRLDRIPDDFRPRVLEHLEAWATAPEEEKSIRVFGGIYAYELEPDPVKRERMKAEVEAQQAAENEFFDSVVRPKIKAWWGGRT